MHWIGRAILISLAIQIKSFYRQTIYQILQIRNLLLEKKSPLFYNSDQIFLLSTDLFNSSDHIRKIFYLDLITLSCSDPQIRQIACQLPLSVLILARSIQIHQITLAISDQLKQPKVPNWPISSSSVVWYLNQSNPLYYYTYTPVTLVTLFKSRTFYIFCFILLICHATNRSVYRFQKYSFLLRF